MTKQHVDYVQVMHKQGIIDYLCFFPSSSSLHLSLAGRGHRIIRSIPYRRTKWMTKQPKLSCSSRTFRKRARSLKE
ncbi:hypothetical protein AN958_12704 [Leucoagaricus sp. SymC.cos]|nr:hypothetical protein AN958_12704 [Leucoagaricus sp. SymC.cos]